MEQVLKSEDQAGFLKNKEDYIVLEGTSGIQKFMNYNYINITNNGVYYYNIEDNGKQCMMRIIIEDFRVVNYSNFDF